MMLKDLIHDMEMGPGTTNATTIGVVLGVGSLTP
jgi:hypothetical protein